MRNICTIPECGAYAYGHGYCQAHWTRWRRHGDPLAGHTSHGLAAQTLQHILAMETDDCIIWPHHITPSGYGAMMVGRTNKQVHVIVCEHFHGPRPDGKEVAHRCGVRACVNYRHVRWATRVENQADRIQHGTSNRGEQHPMAKLTREQVLEIRSRPRTQLYRVIGEAYGVSESAIRSVIDRRTWAWLDTPTLADEWAAPPPTAA